MEAVLSFIAANWQFLSAVLGVALGWMQALEKFHAMLDKWEKRYRQARQFAKSKDLYKVAKTAYGVISKLARKTENKLDDKAGKGLEVALRLMEKLGWDKSEVANGEHDVILKIFEELHESEHLQLEAAHKAPVSNSASKAGEIAAPLAGSVLIK